MADFERPTLTELYERAAADIKAHLPGADLSLRRGNLQVLSRVFAAGDHTMYGYLQWAARQQFLETAETEYLEMHAGRYGIGRKPAAAATGQINVTGISGYTVPAGAEWDRTDGVRYVSTAAVQITSGEAVVEVSAAEPGANGDAAEGGLLSLASYVPGLDQTAQVAAGGITGGADIETDDSLRGRALEARRNPAQGGAETDYLRWAKEISGVTRAFVYPRRLGDGTVGICVLTDGSPDGPIPGQAVIDEVQAHIDELRPVACTPTVFAPTAEPVDFDLRLSPDTDAVRAAVRAEIEDLFLRESVPEGSILISHVQEAISIAAGETDHTLNSPTADITAGAGELLVPGSFTWE